MTFDPPTLPPAGWYPDPERPGDRRWWDGRAWSPTTFGSPNDDRYPDVGDLLARAFGRALRHWRAFVAVALVTSVASGVMVSVAIQILAQDLVVTEDGDLLGWSSDRLVPVIVLGLAAIVLGSVGYLASMRLGLESVDRDHEHDLLGTTGSVDTGSELAFARGAIVTALRALPRAIGWYLVLLLVTLVVGLIMVMMWIAAIAIGVLALLAAVPVVVWLMMRYAFVPLAIVDAPGNPFRRSAEVVDGRWWGTLGRVLLVGIVTSAIAFGVNATVSATGGSGFGGQTIRVDDDGLVERVELDQFAPSTMNIALSALGTTFTAVFTSGVLSAAMADMYRTRRRRPG